MSVRGATVPGHGNPQSATLAFIDTETTSLRPDLQAWEVAFIVRRPGRDDHEWAWIIHAEDLELGNTDLGSLRIGRFFERHPHYSKLWPATHQVDTEAEVLRQVEACTHGAHLIGAVPSFDAEVLAARMRARGICYTRPCV